jgi:hypothetical protein
VLMALSHACCDGNNAEKQQVQTKGTYAGACVVQGQRAERVGSDAGLQHHDLLLHQRGQQRATALADEVHDGAHRGDAGGEGGGDT